MVNKYKVYQTWYVKRIVARQFCAPHFLVSYILTNAHTHTNTQDSGLHSASWWSALVRMNDRIDVALFGVGSWVELDSYARPTCGFACQSLWIMCIACMRERERSGCTRWDSRCLFRSFHDCALNSLHPKQFAFSPRSRTKEELKKHVPHIGAAPKIPVCLSTSLICSKGAREKS